MNINISVDDGFRRLIEFEGGTKDRVNNFVGVAVAVADLIG